MKLISTHGTNIVAVELSGSIYVTPIIRYVPDYSEVIYAYQVARSLAMQHYGLNQLPRGRAP